MSPKWHLQLPSHLRGLGLEVKDVVSKVANNMGLPRLKQACLRFTTAMTDQCHTASKLADGHHGPVDQLVERASLH